MEAETRRDRSGDAPAPQYPERHLTLAAPGQDASAENAVVFLDGDKTDPISFKIGAVTMLLINVEQEPILRAANPHQRTGSDGTPYRSRPDIRLNLSVLFVARFKQYEQTLARLSQVLSFFQSNPGARRTLGAEPACRDSAIDHGARDPAAERAE